MISIKILRLLGAFLVITICSTCSDGPRQVKPGEQMTYNEVYVSQKPTKFEVDPFWPKRLPNNWILGEVAGVATDANDHVWIVQRPGTLDEREMDAIQSPRAAECCSPAPSVIEFDPDGNVLQAWGNSDTTQRWFSSEHGIFVDLEGNVWVGGSSPEDQVVLKFSNSGELLLQIGEWGITKGSNDTKYLGRAADMSVDPIANEVYIADGYGNRRVIVFDATTGEYKRHWGAYGEVPLESIATLCTQPIKSFG